MSITPEATGKILSYVPENRKREPRVDLGEVAEGINLFYEVCVYQRRVAGIPGEPFTGSSTRQPALVLESKVKDGQIPTRFTLVYTADVLAIGDLAERVLDKVTVLQERSQATT